MKDRRRKHEVRAEESGKRYREEENDKESKKRRKTYRGIGKRKKLW